MFDNKKWAEKIRRTMEKAAETEDQKDVQAAMVAQGEAMSAAMKAIGEALGGCVTEETLLPQVAALQRFANMLLDIAVSQGHDREETQELTAMLDSEGGLEMVDKSVLAPIEDELKNGEYINWYARRTAGGQRYYAVKDGFYLKAAVLPYRVDREELRQELEQLVAALGR